jgi:hypothetical protein
MISKRQFERGLRMAAAALHFSNRAIGTAEIFFLARDINALRPDC